jgi:GT2 family glycosyltransferase
MRPESILAVVLNWNGGALNLDCIASILETGLAPGDLVFVDNASTDGSLELVREAYPALTFLANDENLGFGHGVNRGIELALARGADAVLLVNNDVVLTEGMLPALVDEMEFEPTVGIVGPRVLDRADPTRVWCAGGRLTWRQNLSILMGHGAPDGPRFQERRDVDYLAGCAMLIRRAVFERIGLLDGAYFAYHEDLDFCLSAHAAGFSVRLVGDAAARPPPPHSAGGGYSPGRKYMMGVNTIWFLRRHGTPARWLSFFVFDVLTLVPLVALGLFDGRLPGVRAKARGTWDGLLGRRVTRERLARFMRSE